MARLFVDNLTVIDFSYLDSERGIVGESWIVDIELSGALNEQGMVFDFGHVKKQIKHYIDQEIDHCLLVPVVGSGYNSKLDKGELTIEFPLNTGGVIYHQSPQDAVLLVKAETINAKHIADDLQAKIKMLLPENVTKVAINLRPEIINGAYYHYTHGLEKHLGQCQRIAHGHRSRIEIEINGKRISKLETQWANILKDCYIATESHIVDEYELNGIAHTKLTYTAQQGNFSIGLPSTYIFTIPVESTVENIAVCLAELISTECKESVLVKAFEGLNKGAFAEAACS